MEPLHHRNPPRNSISNPSIAQQTRPQSSIPLQIFESTSAIASLTPETANLPHAHIADIRTEHQTLSRSWQVHNFQPGGIQHEANTCYLAAVLNTLSFNLDFKESILPRGYSYADFCGPNRLSEDALIAQIYHKYTPDQLEQLSLLLNPTCIRAVGQGYVVPGHREYNETVRAALIKNGREILQTQIRYAKHLLPMIHKIETGVGVTAAEMGALRALLGEKMAAAKRGDRGSVNEVLSIFQSIFYLPRFSFGSESGRRTFSAIRSIVGTRDVQAELNRLSGIGVTPAPERITPPKQLLINVDKELAFGVGIVNGPQLCPNLTLDNVVFGGQEYKLTKIVCNRHQTHFVTYSKVGNQWFLLDDIGSPKVRAVSTADVLREGRNNANVLTYSEIESNPDLLIAGAAAPSLPPPPPPAATLPSSRSTTAATHTRRPASPPRGSSSAAATASSAAPQTTQLQVNMVVNFYNPDTKQYGSGVINNISGNNVTINDLTIRRRITTDRRNIITIFGAGSMAPASPPSPPPPAVPSSRPRAAFTSEPASLLPPTTTTAATSTTFSTPSSSSTTMAPYLPSPSPAPFVPVPRPPSPPIGGEVEAGFRPAAALRHNLYFTAPCPSDDDVALDEFSRSILSGSGSFKPGIAEAGIPTSEEIRQDMTVFYDRVLTSVEHINSDQMGAFGDVATANIRQHLTDTLGPEESWNPKEVARILSNRTIRGTSIKELIRDLTTSFMRLQDHPDLSENNPLVFYTVLNHGVLLVGGENADDVIEARIKEIATQIVDRKIAEFSRGAEIEVELPRSQVEIVISTNQAVLNRLTLDTAREVDNFIRFPLNQNQEAFDRILSNVRTGLLRLRAAAPDTSLATISGADPQRRLQTIASWLQILISNRKFGEFVESFGLTEEQRTLFLELLELQDPEQMRQIDAHLRRPLPRR